MIIGIDDSGNFQDDNKSLYAAAFIRPKRHKRIEGIFLEWEGKLPDEVKVNGEVKGYKLTNEQLQSFAKTVIDNPIYPIRYLIYMIDMQGESVGKIENKRNVHVEQYRQGVHQYRQKGEKFYKIADQYEQLIAWYKKRSVKTLVKIALLGTAIYESFREAIVHATLKGFSQELAMLQIKIDKAFVDKPEHMAFWQDIVRNQIWSYSYAARGTRRAMPHLKSWNSHHPFVKKFYADPKSKDESAVFSKAFRESFNFYDSKDSFEVRIADIIASAAFRKYVKEEPLTVFDIVGKYNLQTNPYTIFNYTNMPKPPNPYKD